MWYVDEVQFFMLDFLGEYAKDQEKALACAELVLLDERLCRLRWALLEAIESMPDFDPALKDSAEVPEHLSPALVALKQFGFLQAVEHGHITPEQVKGLLGHKAALLKAHEIMTGTFEDDVQS